MRVLNPKYLDQRRLKRQSRGRLLKRLGASIVVLLSLVIGTSLWPSADKTPDNSPKPALLEQNPKTLASTRSVLKKFTPQQFKELYRSIHYPNTQPFVDAPIISGDDQADEVIKNVALKRGFLLTSLPEFPISKTNEPLLKGEQDDLLQPLALSAWQNLKQAAKNESINLSLLSGYRSPNWQRDLFMQRLLSNGVTLNDVANGRANQAVEKTLSLTAIPGFSRHHTGYTIDIHCTNAGLTFKKTNCFRWLSVNNYENAKKYGWIPSYPEGADLQGPEPEAWEYVWVGTEVLYE